MTVVQVVPSIAAESSGPSYSVPALCRGLHSAGCDVSLHFLDGVPDHLSGSPYSIMNYRRHDVCFGNIGISPSMSAGLKSAARDADIIHNNSLWMMPNVYVDAARRGTRCKLVLAPRGTLASWALQKSRLRKRMFGWLFQNRVLANTDMFHATSMKEYEEIRAAGYRQPVAVIPIGMDLPDVEHTRSGEKKTVAFFGRLHKVKAVDNLILAWDKLMKSEESSIRDWELVIAGPDCGSKEYLVNLVKERRLVNVSFAGEINGAAKYEFLSRADIYVLPSLTENFGITLAEALACGTPCIASQGTPWADLEKEKAGRWIPIGDEPLSSALREMMTMSDEQRSEMGRNGKKWIERDFGWDGLGKKMKAAYEWLLGTNKQPDWVVND